ncbi:hypothetical protein [Pseudomonas sp. PNPG3]|uniref:hypothetical protein n=1 Tax=Pseudomonas sp. PNPG3 TaxID=2919497 RepID=UPI001FFC71AA|nr:hypothetical protein [Pseudomonas sp. PNPG3]MCK2123929.1 hypothetical protein [Pseudomonas sp. PNPG3]
MPTEKRSSTIEQHDHIEGILGMVSVPCELLERLDLGKNTATALAALPELRAVLCQPAPQPHPEPIAWMVDTAFWWTKEEAERDAAATGLPVVPVGPLTSSAEIEQLREVIKHSDAQIMRQSMRISNQRAQLAERDALAQAVKEAGQIAHLYNSGDGLLMWIVGHAQRLSASAEPIDGCDHSYSNKAGCPECGEAFAGANLDPKLIGIAHTPPAEYDEP